MEIYNKKQKRLYKSRAPDTSLNHKYIYISKIVSYRQHFKPVIFADRINTHVPMKM